MHVTVLKEICQGHTLCSIAAPHIFKLAEEDGHAYVDDPAVPEDAEQAVRIALSTCPEGAIEVTD